MKIRMVGSTNVIVLVVVSAGLGFFAPGVAAARVANRGIPSGVEDVKAGPQKIAVAEGIFLFILQTRTRSRLTATPSWW